MCVFFLFFFFKQKTAYDMRISDWSSDVCSSDLIISVSVGWWIYDLTRNPLHLGLVGLAQFLPSLLLVLVTGAVSDRFRRRTIMGICMLAEALCAAALLVFILREVQEPWPILAILVVFGTARAFFNTASSSLAPNLVPPEHLGNAIVLTS